MLKIIVLSLIFWLMIPAISKASESNVHRPHCVWFGSPPWRESYNKMRLDVLKASSCIPPKGKLQLPHPRWVQEPVSYIFFVDDSGKVRQSRIRKSSGKSDTDRKAFKLLTQAEPFQQCRNSWLVADFTPNNLNITPYNP